MTILIAGSQGGVAQAIGHELKTRGHQLISISRGLKPEWSDSHLQIDCTQPSSVSGIQQWVFQLDVPPRLVIQCAGILHTENHMPEKALSQISSEWVHQTLDANVLSHVHLAQSVDKLVKRKNPMHWISLSALVGSLSENELGGWYSYRMSKAALNMFIRNLSIEWSRRSPESIVVALHPGTTKTALSEPFQRNIAPGKLYETELTGVRLADIVEGLCPEQHGRLLHWDGEVVPF